MVNKKSGFRAVKIAFFMFNVLFWLMGCALLGIGIWLHLAKGSYGSLLPSHGFMSATVLCITSGVIILLVGFFGCCGAIVENSCMLLTYFVLMVFVFLLEIIVGSLAFAYKTEIEKLIEKELVKGIKEKYGDKDNNLEIVWNQVHNQFNCCGVHNYTDWYGAPKWPDRAKRSVPQSCCVMLCTGQQGENVSLWKSNGCLKELKSWIFEHAYILGVVGLTIAIIQLLGLVASMVLFCYIRKEGDYI